MPNLSGKSIWDVLKQPAPKTVLPSTGPGTGPYQDDTKTSKAPVGIGGKVIPSVGTPDAVGYGGGGDTITYAGHDQVVDPHSDPARYSRQLMPGHAMMGPPRPTLPRFNQLYDGLRTASAWMYTNDVAISGTITPSTSAAVSAAVNGPANLGQFTSRVGQFPGGIQYYLMVRTFGFGASALTMTGSLYVYFVDNGGMQTTPLAILTGTQYDTDLTNVNTILTTPITDAGNTSLGNIWVQMTNGGTPVACTWFLTFSYVYLLPDPAYNGYAADTLPPINREYNLQVGIGRRR